MAKEFENKELKAIVKSLENAMAKEKKKVHGDGVLAQRLAYLENALEMSEKKRRALETKLSSFKQLNVKKALPTNNSRNKNEDHKQKTVDNFVKQNLSLNLIWIFSKNRVLSNHKDVKAVCSWLYQNLKLN